MAEFVNPYNFVRGEYDSSKNAEPLAHHSIHLEAFSGRMECSLKTVTRVTTKGFERQPGTPYEPCLYGSTLKGLFRSISEAIAQGCFTLSGKKCEGKSGLCICCRIFGWMGSGNLHLGRVNISDAKPLENDLPEMSPSYLEEHALSSPKEKHTRFYKSGNRNRGRKFYYHHPKDSEQKIVKQGTEDRKIVIAKPDKTFSFQVDFADLTSAELGLLVYALQLEDGLFHKVGKGKPLGFGTVKITIDAIKLLPQNRYENWDARLTAVEVLPLSELGLPQIEDWEHLASERKRTHFAIARVESFFQEQFGKSFAERLDLPHINDIKHLFSRHDDYPIHYPTDDWFNRNSRVELPTAEEVENDKTKWLKE